MQSISTSNFLVFRNSWPAKQLREPELHFKHHFDSGTLKSAANTQRIIKTVLYQVMLTHYYYTYNN